MKINEITEDISRRGFLKGAGAAAASAAIGGRANAQSINLLQQQYDWQFSDTKGNDKIVKVINREAGGKVAVTARNQYFLIYNWNEIKSQLPRGFDPGPTGIVLMAIPASAAGNLSANSSNKSSVPVAKIKKSEPDSGTIEKQRAANDKKAKDQEELRQQDLEKENKRKEEEMRPELERRAHIRKIEAELYSFNQSVSNNLKSKFNRALGDKVNEIMNIPNINIQLQVRADGTIAGFDTTGDEHARKIFGPGGVSSYDKITMGKPAYDLLLNPNLYKGIFNNISDDLFQIASDKGLMSVELSLGGVNLFNSNEKLHGTISIPKLRELGIRSNFSI